MLISDLYINIKSEVKRIMKIQIKKDLHIKE